MHIYRRGDWTPQSIKHRGLAYNYTTYIYREKADGPLSQLSTETLHTATLHIYRREMDPPSYSSIDDVYTSTPTAISRPHSQLSMDALYTTTLHIYRESRKRDPPVN